MRRTRTVVGLAILVLLASTACRPQAVPTSTPTATPTATLTPTPTPTPTATPNLAEVRVYFTDMDRYAEGTPPFEASVTRVVDASSNLPEAVMRAFFAGPTEQERDEGLALITNGFDGYSSLTIEDGVARLRLTGECQSAGGTYTVAQPIMKNLLQFPEVEYVKIYDSAGNTQLPEGRSNSIPLCLEP